MQTASLIAVGILVIHAMWCLLSPRVSDGILGKVLYLLMSLAAFGYMSRPSPLSQMLLNVSFACIALRHWWMKTYWKKVRTGILSRLNPIGVTPHGKAKSRHPK